MTHAPLAQRIQLTLPVYDAAAAVRAWEDLTAEAPELVELAPPGSDLRALLDAALGASPYLCRSLRRCGVAALLVQSPEAVVAAAQARMTAAGRDAPDEATLRRELRAAKLEAHVMTALADLGGVWPLAAVTGALTDLADAAVDAAFHAFARFENARGRLAFDGAGAPPGLFALAMGKLGAHELNYSSDIDLIVLFDRDIFPVADGHNAQAVAVRITQGMARSLQEMTEDGYVFRVDLRLRPDPGATAAAITTAAALHYYEALGQTWERSALIKARPCAGDLDAGAAFLREIRPFIWRRSLDFAAIDDLHTMKRQIQKQAEATEVTVAGADLKRGYGGIREIEFFAQGHQLIHGGRDTELRRRATLETLAGLVTAGHVTADVVASLSQDYVTLRDIEHRLQMIDDQQTHTVPADEAGRTRLAALCGHATLSAFDAELGAVFARVRVCVDELFPDAGGDAEAHANADAWSIGVIEDTPEALEALKARGFSEPTRVTTTVRAWRAGRVPATRSARAQGLLDRVLPSLLDAVAATDAPDASFVRFAEFFDALPAGVQLLSLFASEPKLMRAVVDLLALAPKLGHTLARRPEVLDIMLSPDFAQPVSKTAQDDAVIAARDVTAAPGFEMALNAARRAKQIGRAHV